MPNRFTGFLDAYDLFGKAIPGVAWFFGLALIAPTTLEVGFTGTSVGLQDLTVLVIISALVGVVFGQGIDILARLFEQLLAWIRTQVRRFSRLALIILGKLSVSVRSRLEPTLEKTVEDHPTVLFFFITLAALFGITAAVLSITATVLAPITHVSSLLVIVIALFISIILSVLKSPSMNEAEENDGEGEPDEFLEWVEVLEDFERPDPSAVLANTYRWVLGRLNAINTTVTPHRSLFAAYLDSRADAYVEPKDPDNIAYSRFEGAVEPVLEVNLEEFGQQEDQSSFVDLYPFITSHLRANGFNRAKGFQARYSFCRSMWLTTSIFATILLGLHLHVTDSPSWGELSRTEPSSTISILLIILWFLLLAVLVGRSFEFIARSIGRYSPTMIWLVGFGYAILTLSSDPVREWLVIGAHRVFWDILASLVTVIVIISEGAASLSSFILGYESFNQVVAVKLFNESLIGLSILLLVSAMAFFDATGSYKRNYVEYLVAEAAIGLPNEAGEPAGDEESSSETDGDKDRSNGHDNGPGSGGGANSNSGDAGEGDDPEASETGDGDDALQMLGQHSATTSSDEPSKESKHEEDRDGD